MPGMDGETATRIIRSSKDAGFNPDIPIIAVTAHAFEENTERFLKAGMNSCVTKPFRREELFSEIERLASVHIKPAKQEGASSPRNIKLIHFEEAMKRLGEDEDLLRELWGIFIGDAPNQMGLLEKAINENDMVLIERQAHSLKSASANIGADSLEKKAFKIEKIANSKSLNSIHLLFDDLQNEFKKVIEELKALQSNNNMIKQ
jgi:HPt (histidine-containing phosphotransfer) domain-containing protein